MGGSFSHAGGVGASGIARWDGTNWFPLGTGLDSGGLIYALAFAPNGDLYAGGRFTNIGGVAVNGLARWDGTRWWDVGGGLTASPYGQVRALLFQGTNLYVGGYFDQAGPQMIAVAGVALWNGLTWSALGQPEAPASGQVEGLVSDGQYLYASGQFQHLGGVAATNFARWDGSSWSSLGYGIPTAVHFFTVAVYEREVVVGGNFSTLGGQSFAGLARWIDNQWWQVGSGLGGSFPVVNSLAASPAGLLVGGVFSQAGTQGANSFAVWNLTNELPAILITTPTNQSVFNGYQTITVAAAAASANGPITSVQFFADGTSVGIATNVPFSAGWSNLTSGAHTLSATATDATGAGWSAGVNITVNLPLNGPIITQQPQSLTLGNGNTAVLTVQATGNGVISYQWFKDGIAIAGATTNSLTLTNSQLSDSAMYTVQVSDSTGTNSSTRAPVSVLQPVTPIWVKPIGLSIFTAPAVGQGRLGVRWVGQLQPSFARAQWRVSMALPDHQLRPHLADSGHKQFHLPRFR